MCVRTFRLERPVIESGIMSYLKVGEGALFPDGQTAVHWLERHGKVSLYKTLQAILNMYEGRTKVIFDDPLTNGENDGD
jgi:hypothetical protein